MKSKREQSADVKLVNKLLKDEAIRLGLGQKNSLAILAGLEDDPKAQSQRTQKEFQEFCRRKLEKGNHLSKNYLVREGARILRRSVATTNRYMESLCTEHGPFENTSDSVHLNPNYFPVEEDPYWQDDGLEEEPRYKPTRRGVTEIAQDLSDAKG
jgi:hypothetical protein